MWPSDLRRQLIQESVLSCRLSGQQYIYIIDTLFNRCICYVIDTPLSGLQACNKISLDVSSHTVLLPRLLSDRNNLRLGLLYVAMESREDMNEALSR
jgi:hypothetical protein